MTENELILRLTREYRDDPEAFADKYNTDEVLEALVDVLAEMEDAR